MPDLKRRKAVMARSVKLGHCVCDPKKNCPCDNFINHNVCSCAGEKMPVKKGDILLTKYVRKAGCASKIGQADLLQVLKKLPKVTDPNVLVGTSAGDDAGIYKLDDRNSLVQTVDVFTPCVDDPYLFGQIAAANSVSDVYAMGGKPLSALSIIGFPIDTLDRNIMQQILLGGIDKLKEANCSLIGGHSINDEEIKCGFAVTGIINTKQVVQRDKARVGDVLILTKPLGMGVISFAAQIGRIDQKYLTFVGKHMATLNKDGAELMVKYNAHACTDVTGYGLAGHLVEMAKGSDVSAEIDISLLPVLSGAAECLENNIFSGAIERNREYSMAWVKVQDEVNNYTSIIYDPQTSGGLLISLPQKSADLFVNAMIKKGHKSTSIIGRIIKKNKSGNNIIIKNNELKNLTGKKNVVLPLSGKKDISIPAAPPAQVYQEEEVACCASPPEFPEANVTSTGLDSPPDTTINIFMDFIKQTNKSGKIDQKNKKLIAVALSIALRCKPCLIIHLKGALSMGISKGEIDEAANMAIAFAGSTVMMFYKEVCKEIGI